MNPVRVRRPSGEEAVKESADRRNRLSHGWLSARIAGWDRQSCLSPRAPARFFHGFEAAHSRITSASFPAGYRRHLGLARVWRANRGPGTNTHGCKEIMS